MSTGTKPSRRIGKRTLVLLWIWVICVFTVVDLFLNVREFDGIRPHASLYRGMRVAAHRMVGEPIGESRVLEAAPQVCGVRQLTIGLDEIANSDDEAMLRDRAVAGGDPRIRIAALRRLGDRAMLLDAAHDAGETPKVRRAAARLLGSFGKVEHLERILESELPLVVRQGAVLGMGELGTDAATDLLLRLVGDKDYGATAVQALERVTNREGGPVLRQAALDAKIQASARVAVCRALSRLGGPETTRALADVLADPDAPADVRAMAANSLGRLCDTSALGTVSAAVTDDDPAVARQALLTRTRLDHVK